MTAFGPPCDLRPDLDSPELHVLLSSLVGWRNEPSLDQRELEKTLRGYRENPAFRVLGFKRGESPVAMVALLVHAPREGVIRHIVVRSGLRGVGFGSALVRELQRRFGLSSISAETHRDAVRFYERSGFLVASLGEKYPGVERFLCTWRSSP